jgi:acyl-CoA reductase-like NAD-dependent aldehyde dehydrogenase
MTATHTSGLPAVEDGLLVFTNPATGEEVARIPIAGADDVAAAVERARTAAAWWAGLGVAGRRTRLLQFRSVLANRMPEIADLLRRECGKPMIEGVTETAAVIPQIAWAAQLPGGLGAGRRQRHGRQAQRVHPGGVSQWLADRFAEVVPEHPVLQVVHGLADTGAALCRSGVDKIAFIGSATTAKKVMATCAETLTPVLAEGGGKDAMIVAGDADLDAAADAALWGGLGNAGQTCTGIERIYVASAVADQFIDRLVTKARKLRVGVDSHAALGPIIMPGQLDIIRRHIADGLANGGTAALGGRGGAAPVCAADHSGRRPRGLGRGPGGDLRPGAGGQPGPRRRRGDRPRQRAALCTGRLGVRPAPRVGVGPPPAIGHDSGELGAVVCRHAELALRRRG